ncbi:hypothetical protein [Winogradskyella aquimaris]|uniref:Uncharacterized protein n=1 Tax=Winogradskyella aquimaris TaxID=864074 RepID=A0ABU5ELF7_9FLAO|nr:hypothetical protein [Winogradskyella aquimaris]MDY2586590.1 hypothetical protein [Winogradskyella aquimaris]
MMIDNRKGLINCIYAGGTQFSAQIEAILKATDKNVHAIDITKTMPSDTIWHDIAIQLNRSLKSFMDPRRISNFETKADYSEEGLVKILAKYPEAFVGAIVMEGKHVEHITRYTELLKFFNVDSAGLEKTMHSASPTIERQTSDEHFI